MPRWGGLFATGAFCLNSLTPRLSTLVDTNMLLGFWVFIVGWMLLTHIREERVWTKWDRWLLGIVVLGGLMSKGPTVFAFLIPGLILYAILDRRWFSRVPGVRIMRPWATGIAAWLIPLALFLGWVWFAASSAPEFKDEVVGKEFLGRFSFGATAVHRSQSPFFYLLHLLLTFAPWSWLLIGLYALSSEVRKLTRTNPEVLWLFCWSVGGLVFMSIIPSKRVDRIFLSLLHLACCWFTGFEEPGWRLQMGKGERQFSRSSDRSGFVHWRISCSWLESLSVRR